MRYVGLRLTPQPAGRRYRGGGRGANFAGHEIRGGAPPPPLLLPRTSNTENMKQLLIPALLLAAASAHGQLTTASGDRMTDYTAWFHDPFAVTSDAYYPGVPNPFVGTPGAFTDPGVRMWSGWDANFPTSPLAVDQYANPLGSGLTMRVEVVFLGETAGWWDDFGYTINGADHLLADSVQTIPVNGPVNRSFGDFAEITLLEGQTLDLFITGTGVFGPNPGETPTTGTTGGKYYLFHPENNTPTGSSTQSYVGSLVPLSSVRGDGYLDAFTIAAFEDINQESGRDNDFNDFIFATRLVVDIPVPEPSTYGLVGAAVLLALAGYRRWRQV